MKKMKQGRKTRYTQMVLQDSLVELMKQKPIAKITIKELCENADINRTTFYAHYTDQYDLLQKMEEECLSYAREAISNLIGEKDQDVMMKLLEEIFQYFIDNRNHIQVLMSEQGDINFQKQLFAMIYEFCGIAPDSGKNAGMGTKEFYFVFVVSGSVGLIQHWLKDDAMKSAREMAEIIYNVAGLVR
ncbi:TetR-like C-terminal domain-containing protein [Kineothrix sedimenti]|uniref:TetR-like C-terminal domain-containing protein n=1 Tax=Kineothrix sedimenti TaxID=3123317 RepID=A0ABZ3EXI4_9FIRM